MPGLKVATVHDLHDITRHGSGGGAWRGTKFQTFPVESIGSASSAALTSAQLQLSLVYIGSLQPITDITYYSGSTPLSVGLNQHFSLWDFNRNKLCATADDTSTAWLANTKKKLVITGGPFAPTYVGWHYVGIVVKATTPPTVAACAIGTAVCGDTDVGLIVCGNADAGLTTPASLPTTAAAITPTSQWLFARGT